MSLSLNAPLAKLTFSYRGTRQDPTPGADNDTNAQRGPEDVTGQYASIALADPAQHALPFFSFANGTNFSWSHDSEHRYSATASAASVWAPATWNAAALMGAMAWMLL